MRPGLFTDGLQHLSRRDALAWCAERGILDVEMGVGTWSPRPHLDLAELLRERSARDALLGELREHGVSLACVNAAGNPLHPEPASRAEAQAAIDGAVELAALLGVDRVVTMAGCPGGRTGGPVGVFAVWSLVSDDEPLWAWQMEHEVAPYWHALSQRAVERAPDLRICLELHPGVAIYSLATFRALQRHVGANVGVNLDPSHFFWQGVDPLALVDELGPAIGFAHGKDTIVHADRVALHGLLDHRYPVDPDVASWHFAACGDGHDARWWRSFLDGLAAAGHDGVVSIEHEDPRLDPETSIERSLATLRAATGAPA